MPNTRLTLNFDIQTEWHIGTGDEGGAYADALMLKDQNNLPYIPGRSIRGLLKEAFLLMQDSIKNSEAPHLRLTKLLFGEEGAQGLLRITNATLSEQEIAYFNKNKQSGACKHLYRVHYTTAVNNKTGVAKEGTLRGMEVAAPMALTCSMTLDSNHPSFNKFDNKALARHIEEVVPLITNIGAKRHRGYGQVVVTVIPPKEANNATLL